MKVRRLFKFSIKLFRNKYTLSLLIFLAWLTFFDNNNLLDRWHNRNVMRQLNKDRDYYQKKISDDRMKLKQLKTDNKNLEKFAREQYLMKKDNEDIFIIEEK
jgi:cell division protein DivIC